MIKSIKLANSYTTEQVGYIAKDLSNLYNLNIDVEFSVIILKSFFEKLIEDNTIKNKIQSLLNNIDGNSDKREIEEIFESIAEAIINCEFSEELKEYINDAYETLPWQKTQSAKELLGNPQHKIDIIASPNYITAPLIISNIEKEQIFEKIKQAYAHFFTKEEIMYRLTSGIDEEFSISLIMQKHQDYNATAFCCPDKNLGILKLYVFPGCININDMIKPDNEVRPDYYEIIRDTLRLRNSIAGKQKFKNTCLNGEYKRQECNITNFIIDDYVASELARITKKAGVLLEKDVQVIFNISENELIIEHVSNILDLQKEYYSRTKGLIKKQETEETTNVIADELESVEDSEIKDPLMYNDIEQEDNIEINNNKDPEDILTSDKPLSELMSEEKQEENVELQDDDQELEQEDNIETSDENLEDTEKEGIDTEEIGTEEYKENNQDEESIEEPQEYKQGDLETEYQKENVEERGSEEVEDNLEQETQDDNDILNAEPINILNNSEKEENVNNLENNEETEEQEFNESEEIETEEYNQEDDKDLEEEINDEAVDIEESEKSEDKELSEETKEDEDYKQDGTTESDEEIEDDQDINEEEPQTKDDDFIL